MGYGYLLLDAIDPVEEVGDLAGDSVLRRTGENAKVNLLRNRKYAEVLSLGVDQVGGIRKLKLSHWCFRYLFHRERLILKAATGVKKGGARL